ncbi:MAG: RecQ family ATP-dependent DNA helicase [Planctomycetota bacterium]|nr:RecQ family ATP-dependent DNA helicase [Planctomycetota bacterium]
MISPTPTPDSDLPVEAPPAAHEALRATFGHDTFRDGQEEVVAAVLSGRDVLCVMPTGAGKSLCYQLPALLREGVTLVVSPLISLMQDQVDSLKRRGVEAAEINSSVPVEEQEAAMDRAASGELKLLYVAPERFRNERFRRRIAAVGVSLVAVDEAHCISQWGHDFRPDYRRLGQSLEGLGSPQVLGLTATAPPDVQDDVCVQLALREPVRFVRGIVRENLAYDVVRARGKDTKDRALARLVEEGGGTLIYCATRKEVDRVHASLKSDGLEARRYHAGLDPAERQRGQDEFLSGQCDLMVATNAFGMGVDRPDIRRVVHYAIPKTIEAFVQETGRAGRDGEDAACVLLFDPADLHIQRFFIETSNPSREVVLEVFRVLQSLGEGRLELTADAIADRMHLKTNGRAVASALAVLDRAAVVRRGQRGDNLARVTVLPSAGDLFTEAPLPPGLGRMFSHLVTRFGVDRPSSLDVPALAAERGVTAETVRRGLNRLHDLGRIRYVAAFRGRATEVAGALSEDALDGVDFELLETKRRREEDRLEEMIGFTATPGCRVRYLLACFGVEESGSCGRCDRCKGGTKTHGAPTAAASEREREMVLQVLTAVEAFDKRFGFKRLAGHLGGSRSDNVLNSPLGTGDTYGALRHLGPSGAERWLRTAYDAGLLRLAPHKLKRGGRTVHLVALSPQGKAVLAGEPLPALHL